MSDAAALILQPQIVSKPIAKVNLLIVGDSRLDLDRIVKTLRKARIDFTHSSISSDRQELSTIETHYDAILYNYYRSRTSLPTESPLGQLDWWFKLKQNIPLIIITEALGDELAVECIQAGVSGYILRNRLHKLPEILHQCLLNFAQQQQTSFDRLQPKTLIKRKEEKQPSTESELFYLNKAEYISYLTHELRAPLTGILGFSRVLLEEIFGSLNPKQKQYIGAIAESGEHLLELVNDFLDIFKIDANKEILYPETLAVEDVCRASMSILQEKAREKGIEFRSDLDERIDFCVADRRRLKQILVNLLSNAIKFTEVGSVILKVEPQGDEIVFSVIDTGIGIAEEDCQKLFQPFHQIKSHLHTRYNSTGLGLALSLRLSRLHGGNLSCTSELGKGSCFNLYLPMKRD
jgi:signal transduction histidine kinase